MNRSHYLCIVLGVVLACTVLLPFLRSQRSVPAETVIAAEAVPPPAVAISTRRLVADPDAYTRLNIPTIEDIQAAREVKLAERQRRKRVLVWL